MLKPRWVYLFIVLTVIGWLAASKPAQSQSTVTVAVVPGIALVAVDQTTDVAVEVINVQDLYGFDLALTFNPSAVEIIDADPSQAGVQAALGTFLDSGFVVLNAVDNVSGTLRFAMTQLNPSEPKSGTGTLVVMRMRGKQASGGTPLTLTNAQLAGRDGSGLSTNLISGVISVVSSTGSAPTGTPIPTHGAGTPMPASTPVSQPATAVPTIGSATVQPTPASLVTGSSATITPGVINQPATTTSSASTQDSTASSATNPAADSVRAAETPPTSVSSAPLTTEATSTPAAVAAVAAPSPTSADIQAAIQVTEQPATPSSSTPGSAPALLVLSGALGIAGIVAVWLVMRRRSQ